LISDLTQKYKLCWLRHAKIKLARIFFPDKIRRGEIVHFRLASEKVCQAYSGRMGSTKFCAVFDKPQKFFDLTYFG
jgi:hypothetical protein